MLFSTNACNVDGPAQLEKQAETGGNDRSASSRQKKCGEKQIDSALVQDKRTLNRERLTHSHYENTGTSTPTGETAMGANAGRIPTPSSLFSTLRLFNGNLFKGKGKDQECPLVLNGEQIHATLSRFH